MLVSHPQPARVGAACMPFVLLTCIFPQFDDVCVCVFNHLIREFLIVLTSSCCNLCKMRVNGCVCAGCVPGRKYAHCGPSSCLKSFVKRCLAVRAPAQTRPCHRIRANPATICCSTINLQLAKHNANIVPSTISDVCHWQANKANRVEWPSHKYLLVCIPIPRSSRSRTRLC